MNINTNKLKFPLSTDFPPILYAENGESLSLSLDTEITDHHFVYNVSVKNETNEDITPDAIVLRLGIDSYMATYPEWHEKLFPTALRCEKTHFWGYFSSPNGNIVGIGCTSPIASWRNLYNKNVYGAVTHYGHRVFTSELLLLKNGNIPERHPKISTVKTGEELNYKIILFSCDSLELYPEQLYRNTGIPFLGLDRCSVVGDERPSIRAVGYSTEEIQIIDDGAEGNHRIIASNDSFTSEAVYYRRRPWSYYLKEASRYALEKPQKATTNCESWLGLFSLILAQKRYPDQKISKHVAYFKQFFLISNLTFAVIRNQTKHICGILNAMGRYGRQFRVTIIHQIKQFFKRFFGNFFAFVIGISFLR